MSFPCASAHPRLARATDSAGRSRSGTVADSVEHLPSLSSILGTSPGAFLGACRGVDRLEETVLTACCAQLVRAFAALSPPSGTISETAKLSTAPGGKKSWGRGFEDGRT